METRTYGPVTEAQATQFLEDAKNNGLTVTPATADSGVVTGYGTEVSYRYDTAKQSLELSLVKHPPLLGGVVWGQVEQRYRQASRGRFKTLLLTSPGNCSANGSAKRKHLLAAAKAKTYCCLMLS